MKGFLVSILIFLVAVQSFSKWLIVLDYQVNQEYISRVLCENKARPQLNCKGKCQLVKKLVAEEKQNGSKENNSLKLQYAEVLFVTEQNKEKLFPVLVTVDAASTRYLIKPYTAPVIRIFHPPLQG